MSHKFKGAVRVEGNLSLPNESTTKALYLDGSGQIKSSAVTSTELGYLSGVTSSIQTQFSNTVSNTLADGKIYIGSAGNIATAQTVSGDISISNAGVVAISTGVIVNADINASAAIAYSKLNLSGSIVNADINTTAAIALSKLASLTASKALVSDASGVITASSVTSTELGYLSGVTSAIQTQLDNKLDKALANGKIFIGDSNDLAAAQTVSGDITLSNAGVAAISSGVIVDADINSSAAITLSKLAALTSNKAIVSDGSGVLSASSVTSTELGYVSGVTSAIQTQLDNKISSSEKGANNGVATLDAGGKIPASQLPNSVMEYKGNWDASSNTPTLVDGTGNAGDVYRVNVAGTQDLGSGSQTFLVGDWVVYNGSIWEKSVNSNSVVSVNGQSGVVTLDSDDISEGATNLYFTDERAQDAVGASLTDSSTIDFTYTDGSNTITAVVKPASLDESFLAPSTQIPYSKLSLSNSILNSDLAGNIAFTKLASLTSDRAIVSNGSGVISVSAVTSTELGYLSGVTSAIQTQLNGKAATSLSNLSAVAINTHLLPDVDITQNLGSATYRWLSLYAQYIKASDGSKVFEIDNRLLTDSSEAASLNFDQRLMKNSSSTTTLNWEQSQLRNGPAVLLNWSGSHPSLESHKLTNVSAPTDAQDAANKEYVDGAGAPVVLFNGAEGQASPVNLTGMSFGDYVAFEASLNIEITATSKLNEIYHLMGTYNSDSSTWTLTQNSSGDDTLVVISITNSGQLQYTSSTYAGFSQLAFRMKPLAQFN